MFSGLLNLNVYSMVDNLPKKHKGPQELFIFKEIYSDAISYYIKLLCIKLLLLDSDSGRVHIASETESCAARLSIRSTPETAMMGAGKTSWAMPMA